MPSIATSIDDIRLKEVGLLGGILPVLIRRSASE